MFKPKIAFAWDGLPDYAARCIRAVVERHPGDVTVIGTRPAVPLEGMEDSLGQSIVWIEGRHGGVGWEELGLGVPDLFFQGGYYLPAFRRLGSQCRKIGGKVVCLADTEWRGGFRQLFVDPLRHRVVLRGSFDGLFVPGRSGLRYAKHVGYSLKSTLTGLLGADPVLFSSGQPLDVRPKSFLFVGRLEPIKNILGLASAFVRFSAVHPDWRLRICGSGSESASIPDHPQIDVSGFAQPCEIAAAMRDARCLVLPSMKEPWGVVVHEAVLSGCALALSTAVGSGEDFADPANAILFDSCSIRDIEKSLHMFASWTGDQWRAAHEVSIRNGAQFGPATFADSVDRYIDMFF